MTDVVNVGTTDDDGNGDTLRAAFSQINTRFNELLSTIDGGDAWATGVTYTATPIRQWVINAGQAYVAAINHVSGASFAADLSAGKWFAVDSAQLRADLLASSGSSIVGYLPAGTGAVATDVESELNRVVRVENFGTDYTAAVNALAQAAATGSSLVFGKTGTGIYDFGDNELVFATAGLTIEFAQGVEIRGTGANTGFIISFASAGGTSQPVSAHPANQRVTGMRVRSVTPFSASATRSPVRVCGSYNLFTDCSATTSADNGGNGWMLEADNTGSGPYYNTFLDCNIQGPQNGAATGSGVAMRQKAGTSVATRYPNTNTFIGGRVGGYATNVELCGAGNRFIGVASENSSGYGTAFKWLAPVSSSNIGNQVISPYLENAAIGFEVQANTSSPSVVGQYATGVTTLLSDPSNRLTVYGQDGVRDLRLAKAPNASSARSGIYLGNTANADSETLDWYEEVTFTPIMIGSTSLGAGTTHGVQVGRATRIGNRVIFSGSCSWTATTETGNIQIDLNDIPWSSIATSNTNTPVNVRVTTLSWTAGKQVVGLTLTGTKKFQLEQLDPAGGAVAQVPIDASAGVFFSGEYLV